MDFRKFDLNGLRALDFLLTESLVSRAACMPDVSQPAGKATLARLGTDQPGQ
jgi:hypothetical protein